MISSSIVFIISLIKVIRMIDIISSTSDSFLRSTQYNRFLQYEIFALMSEGKV